MKRFLIGLMAMAAIVSARAATTLNLKDADINTLITTVSEVTGKNFIVDERVKGKVTVISAKPMSAAGVYETFLAVLEIKGFAAVPAGEAIKIVPETSGKTDGGSVMGTGTGLPYDDIVTNVFQIDNVSAAQLVTVLRPLMPQWAHIAAYTPANMLIVSDRAANVVRMAKIIEQIDQTGDRDIELVKLQYAAASEVVRTLTSLSQQDKAAAETGVKPPTIIADERTNAVLIGGDKSERQKILEVIKQLDVQLPEDASTQVVYLHYASAQNLAPIMEGYAQQADAAGTKNAGAAGGGAAPAAASAASYGGGGTGKSRVIADKDTNALVITASPKVMRALKTVIAQLDIRRSQVLVEAVIAEVSAGKSAQLGIDWAVFNPERIAMAGILDPTTLTTAASIAAAASGVGGTAGSATSANAVNGIGNLNGVIGGFGRISDGGRSGTSFAVLLRALQGDSGTNVLSTPSVVATDNEESEISVGQEVPFQTGRYSTTAANVGGGLQSNPFTTIERKPVGLTLGMTPTINAGDSVKMKLKLEVSSLAACAGAVDLCTNKRTLNTVVSVETGQILVLGGLIDDNVQDTESGIPFLSSIPLIGPLFQFRTINKQKRNLMVFIRPSILTNGEEVDYYTRRKYDAVRQSQIDLTKDPLPTVLPRSKQPILPEYEKTRGSPTKAPGPMNPDEKVTPGALMPPPTPAPAPKPLPESLSPGPTAPAATAPGSTAPAGGGAVAPPASAAPAPGTAPPADTTTPPPANSDKSQDAQPAPKQ